MNHPATTSSHELGQVNGAARQLYGSPYNIDSISTVSPLSVHPIGGFYGTTSESEANRLQMMAYYADVVSVTHIANMANSIGGQQTIVDVGCGDSTTLGEQLRQLGQKYIPVDMRVEAVEKHKSSGFPAVRSVATNLDIPNGAASIVHARFTYGWLTPNERTTALAESLRIGKSNMAMTIVDYDWSTVEGPDEFVHVIEKVKDVMRKSGFEPDYGDVLKGDVENRLSDLLDLVPNSNEGYLRTDETRNSFYDGSIEGAFGMIESTANSIVTQIKEVGMIDDANMISTSLERLRLYTKQNPDVRVKLPDIVSVDVIITGKDNFLSEKARKHLNDYSIRKIASKIASSEILIAGTDYDEVGRYVEGLENVVETKSSRLTLAARIVQGIAYVKDNIVTWDALDENGALNGHIDPTELVERSRYFVSLANNRVGGLVRMIDVDDRGIMSCPTIERLSKHSPIAYAALSKSPIMNAKVFELSALGKEPLEGSFKQVLDAVLMVGKIAYDEGYDFAVMGLQEPRLELMELMFGSEALQKISGEDAIHAIQLDGVRDAIRFVPIVVNAKTFIHDVNKHVSQKLKGQPNSSTFKHLHNVTTAILNDRRQ